jgi:hypothetical protein
MHHLRMPAGGLRLWPRSLELGTTHFRVTASFGRPALVFACSFSFLLYVNI